MQIDPNNMQTMGFPCLPELHPSAMFVTLRGKENAEKESNYK